MSRLSAFLWVAILLPSVGLGWLALRTVQNQQALLEHRQRLLCETAAETVARDCTAALADFQTNLAATVDTMLAQKGPLDLAAEFDATLLQSWNAAEVGFVVSVQGELISPSLFSRPAARQFRVENENFLCRTAPVQISYKANEGAGVAPSVTEEQFQTIITNTQAGMVSRFLANQLTALVHYRPKAAPELVFGAKLKRSALTDKLAAQIMAPPHLRDVVSMGLLDEGGRRIGGTLSNSPLAAIEISPHLRHWKVGAAPANPALLSKRTRNAQATIIILVIILLAAIAAAGALISSNLRRQLRLAREKTEFVSNVSHELKTPLTTIRLFSEMLAEKRVPDPEKQRQFLHLINSEASRLTRLINNVLDFARNERGDRQYTFSKVDLRALISETIETMRPQLEAAHFDIHARLPSDAVCVRGDRDALSQLVLNLLSNAEKYSAERKEITIELQNGAAAELRVMDRGIGVPEGAENTIFEQFYRAPEALSKSIPGAGLGLTLARQIARAHHGDIHYAPRTGGGSCFTFRLPIASHSQE